MSPLNGLKSPLYALTALGKEFGEGESKLAALRNVTLDIAPREFVALTGPSGSGKSTLLNILGLIETPSVGSLFFCGKDLSHSPETERVEVRRRLVGFIFQNFNLVPVLSAQENVEYALHLVESTDRQTTRKRALEALALVGMEGYAHRRPSELSGGQRQRVAIARAIVKRPALILADEPTANLDTQNAQQIVRLFESLIRAFGTTVVMATHNLEFAGRADRQVRLRDGVQVPDVYPEKFVRVDLEPRLA